MRTLLPILVGLVLTMPVLAAVPVNGDPDPKQAFEAIQREVAAARAARNYAGARALPAQRAKQFMVIWEKSGKKAEGEGEFYLGQLLGMAGRHGDALKRFRACLANGESLPEGLRPSTATMFARAVLNAMNGGELKGEAARKAVEEAEGHRVLIPKAGGSMAGSYHQTLAYAHDRLGDTDACIEHWLAATDASPMIAYSAARGALGTMLAQAYHMEDYESLRERGMKLHGKLEAAYRGYVEELKTSAAPDDRRVANAERTLDRFATMGKPFEMLGKPAPQWVTLHAYGKTKGLQELRGKVVMVDFWATWCGWCIRSFPALREVLIEYDGKDFVLIGATEPAGSVTNANFALDDDLKEKAASFTPVRIRMPQNATPEQIARFRALERDLIAQFIENHGLTWDVVLIREKEASTRFALTGWPHAVVLDRQGRVRWFKRGALLRDRPEGIAKLKKVLDALLAE